MFNNIFLIFALFIVLFLSSCSNKSEIIEGERISVFENKNEVFINEDAYNEGTNLGKIIQNNIFTHPGLNAQHSGGNLEGPMDDEIQNISISYVYS